jgi:hypothetical protein
MALFASRKQNEILILAPSGAAVPGLFENRQENNRKHTRLLSELQRFRGRIYAADGAIGADELSEDGRHESPVDDHAWHVLSVDPGGHVVSCLRYVEETWAASFDDLWVQRAAKPADEFQNEFRRGVEWALEHARRLGLHFGEVGGWAVSEESRLTTEPLRILLATYGLLELLGGCFGVATATLRHGSAHILRRVGLAGIPAGPTEMDPYYDLHHACEMELLSFDSRSPNPRYKGAIEQFCQILPFVPVVCREAPVLSLRTVFPGFDFGYAESAFLPNGALQAA